LQVICALECCIHNPSLSDLFYKLQVAVASSRLELAEPTAAAGAADATLPGNDVGTEIIHVGDSLTIVFSDLPDAQKDFDVRVNDEGAITLIQNQKFIAAGKTRAQLEKGNPRTLRSKVLRPDDRHHKAAGTVVLRARRGQRAWTAVLSRLYHCLKGDCLGG
jgi:hypothetical protein